MSGSADEMRAALSRLERDLESLRQRRARRPTVPSTRPRGSLAVESPARSGRSWWKLALLLACAAAGGAGVALEQKWLLAAAFAGLSAALLFAAGDGGSDAGRLEELFRRLAALERRGASAGPDASPGIEEDLQEIRTILRSLMEALEEPPKEAP